MADRKDSDREGKGIEIFRFTRLFKNGGLIHGFSTRRETAGSAGEFNMSFRTADSLGAVVENRRRFCRALGIRLEDAVFMQQSHSDNVGLVTQADAGRGAETPESAVPTTDAMITRERGVCLAGLGADCAVVALHDPAAGVVGIAHAGWRGMVLGVVEKVVAKMRSELGCDPADLLAGIGPSIGPCCYEVGDDVLQAARRARGAEAITRRGGRLFLDLRQANVRQLLAQGVRSENIEVADLCTSCARDRFFSYRRDGAVGGRFCGMIGLKS